MNPLAITAIVVGLLVLCLGIIIAAGAIDEIARRRIAARR